MAKPKFTLNIAPTFKAPVDIQIPGGKSAVVEFTFKYRERKEFKEFMDSLPGSEDVDVLMDVASGWDLDEPFDAEHVTKMTERFMGSAQSILDVYLKEMTGARAKN